MKKHLNTEEFLRRKRLIAAYLEGLETGDTDLTAAVWLAAETDAELERILDEINFDYESEFELTPFAAGAKLVRELADEHLQTRFEKIEFEEKVLTLGDVARKLEDKRRVPTGDETTNKELLENAMPLPEWLGLSEIKRLAAELKIKASEHFWSLFRKEAIFLTMRQSQQQAAFATRAKRLQKKRKKTMNQLSQEKKEKINKMARQIFVQNNLDYDDPQAQIVPLNRIFTESPIIVAELPNGKTLSTENAVKFLEREIGFEMPDLQTDERKLSGFLYVAQDGKQFRGCILTDKTEPTVRRRFSAAHELGHYLLHFLPLLEITHTENLFLTESLAFGDEDKNEAEIEMAEDFGFRQINKEKNAKWKRKPIFSPPRF